MLRTTPRLIEAPNLLHDAMHATFSLFGYQLDRKTQAPLFSHKAWDSIDEADKHFEKGCCSDLPNFPMYYTGTDGKILYCLRGTSALEGWHKYLRALLTGRTSLSPVAAYHLIMAKTQRWNMQMAIDRLGERDYGTFDMRLLITLSKLDRELSITGGK